MKLSIIIPCFNEQNTIIDLLTLVKNNPYKNKEVIVVDDYSSDNTRKLLSENQNLYDSLILLEKNKGKGAAIKSGIEKVTGDIVIIQDADLEYDPNEYLELISPILNNKADVVYGSRFQGGKPHRILYFWHTIGNKFLTLLSNMFTNLNLTDMECCYKLFRVEIIRKINLNENRFGFEPEVTAKISRMKCRIYEVGVSYYGRTYNEGKKIGWKDGISAIKCIIKYGIFSK
tara:strand:+ start:1132 stop:1821 length:690 start_codon:yes stop_codon:yes gene_type:complete